VVFHTYHNFRGNLLIFKIECPINKVCETIYKNPNKEIKINKMFYKVGVVIEKDEYGYYAYCPELKGCQTQGDTLEETISNIKEAIDLYMATLPENEKITCLSREILTTSVGVEIPA